LVPYVAVELSTASVIVAIGAFAAVAGLAVWLIPRRQRQRWERSGVSGKDLAELENSSRATLVQLLGGVALILTFVATWLQISDARDASEDTLRLTAAQQETERFTRAVEQLGSPQPEVRLGGIYGLAQAARDTPSRRQTVGRLMLAYLRTNHSVLESEGPGELEDRVRIALELQHSLCHRVVGSPEPDAQAALSVLLGIPRAERPPMDLTGIDLANVQANGADFSGAVLRGTSMAGAKLMNTVFDRAHISGESQLQGACLRGARFRRTYLGLVDTRAADFSRADLSAATVVPGSLDGALTD
jgi:membrane protein implicated in regulation of membrane protease activity